MQAERTFRVEYMAKGGDWGHVYIHAATPADAERIVKGWRYIHPQRLAYATHEKVGKSIERLSNHPL